jgi:tetratricopeptide (TPR) repeat protein
MKHYERWFVAAITAVSIASLSAQERPVAQGAATRAAAQVKGSVAEGVELTKRAKATTSVAEKQASLRQAEEIYVNVLKANPKQGAALNNLAVLAVEKGDSAAARNYFEQAIASDDGHKALYALNYSKYLQNTDKPAAIKAARVAAAAAPDSTVANEHLGNLLWQTNRAEMLPFANDLAERGHTELATRFALQCLTSQSRPAGERRAWLNLLAARLAKEYEISATVRESISRDLGKLQSDPEIGAGARQLRAAINAPPQSVKAIEWWQGESSSRAAMRDMLLAAGEFHSRRNADPAAQYFKLAIDLGEDGPDPDAFLRLVELYASSGADRQLAAATRSLAELMDRYQNAMFREKSAAYRKQDWRLIYRMHVALGMTYGHLKVWQSDVGYQNALFQLSSAMRAAERANAERRPGVSLLALPPVGIAKLAEGYVAIGREDLATKARIDGATALNKIGHAQDSAEAFRAIPASAVQRLDEASRTKYETLRSALPGA